MDFHQAAALRQPFFLFLSASGTRNRCHHKQSYTQRGTGVGQHDECACRAAVRCELEIFSTELFLGTGAYRLLFSVLLL